MKGKGCVKEVRMYMYDVTSLGKGQLFCDSKILSEIKSSLVCILTTIHSFAQVKSYNSSIKLQYAFSSVICCSKLIPVSLIIGYPNLTSQPGENIFNRTRAFCKGLSITNIIGDFWKLFKQAKKS